MNILFSELTLSAQTVPLLLLAWLLLHWIASTPKQAAALAVSSQRKRSKGRRTSE